MKFANPRIVCVTSPCEPKADLSFVHDIFPRDMDPQTLEKVEKALYFDDMDETFKYQMGKYVEQAPWQKAIWVETLDRLSDFTWSIEDE